MGKANATFEVITKYVGNTLLIQSSPRYDTVSFLWLIGNKDWENSRQLCKPETKSKVCITVENSPTPQVFISAMQTRKKVSYCFYKITLPREKRKTLVLYIALIKREILTSRDVSYTKSCTRNGSCFAERCFPKYRFFSLKMSA